MAARQCCSTLGLSVASARISPWAPFPLRHNIFSLTAALGRFCNSPWLFQPPARGHSCGRLGSSCCRKTTKEEKLFCLFIEPVENISMYIAFQIVKLYWIWHHICQNWCTSLFQPTASSCSARPILLFTQKSTFFFFFRSPCLNLLVF